MRNPFSRAVRILLLLAAAFAAQPMQAHRLAPTLQLDLRPEVVVSGRYVTIGDLAAIKSGDAQLKKTVEELQVGNAPRVGYVDRMSRAELELAVRKELLNLHGKAEWSGAAAVKISMASRRIDPDDLVAAAKSYLLKEIGGRFEHVEADLAAPLGQLELPMGEVKFMPRALENKHFYSRQPVWVDVHVDGVLYRSVVVPFTVRASQSVYVARRDLAEGSVVSAADFAVKVVDVSEMTDQLIALPSLQEPVRVKRALAAGQIATRKNLSQQGTVLRGDSVKLMLAEGGFLIETRAVAQQDGAIGQMVKVKPEQGFDEIIGRVVSQGVVQAYGR